MLARYVTRHRDPELEFSAFTFERSSDFREIFPLFTLFVRVPTRSVHRRAAPARCSTLCITTGLARHCEKGTFEIGGRETRIGNHYTCSGSIRRKVKGNAPQKDRVKKDARAGSNAFDSLKAHRALGDHVRNSLGSNVALHAKCSPCRLEPATRCIPRESYPREDSVFDNFSKSTAAGCYYGIARMKNLGKVEVDGNEAEETCPSLQRRCTCSGENSKCVARCPKAFSDFPSMAIDFVSS